MLNDLGSALTGVLALAIILMARDTSSIRSRPLPGSASPIVARLAANPGVRPEDVLISVIETAAENWSFGNGETQFYEPADRQPAAA